MIKNAWGVAEKLAQNGKKHFCLEGESSVGKSYFSQVGDFYTLTCHEQMQVSEIIGHVWPNGNKWEWRDGPATLAMRKGTRLVINDMGLANPEVLDVMLGVCDTPESAMITLPTGEIVKPAKGFLVVATTNHDPVNTMAPALYRRFIHLKVTEPHPNLIKRIATGSPELAKLVQNSYKAGGGAQIDCRAALNYLDLVKVGDFDNETAALLSFGPRGKDIVAMLPAVK